MVPTDIFPDRRIDEIEEQVDDLKKQISTNRSNGQQTVRRLNAMEVQYKNKKIFCHFCNKEMATRYNYKRHLKGRW